MFPPIATLFKICGPVSRFPHIPRPFFTLGGEIGPPVVSVGGWGKPVW